MSWFVFGNSYKKNAKNLETLTANEKIAYDILNNAFKDADTSGIPLVLANILEEAKNKNDSVKKLITDQFLLTYTESPEAQAAKRATAPAAGGRRARKAKKSKRTRKAKKSKRGTRRA